jgi:hypothetical protein
MKTGTELISEERQRQILHKGFTPDHDKQHREGELAEAAICYAVVACAQTRGSSVEEWPASMFDGFRDSIITWPWDEDAYKPSEYALRNLVKAGALIAAQIDRLQAQ